MLCMQKKDEEFKEEWGVGRWKVLTMEFLGGSELRIDRYIIKGRARIASEWIVNGGICSDLRRFNRKFRARELQWFRFFLVRVGSGWTVFPPLWSNIKRNKDCENREMTPLKGSKACAEMAMGLRVLILPWANNIAILLLRLILPAKRLTSEEDFLATSFSPSSSCK